MRNTLLAILLAAAAGFAHAEFIDGNKLLAAMQGTPAQQGFAVGYVTGVADAVHGNGYCPRPDVKVMTLHDVVKSFLIIAPERRNETADLIVLSVLKAGWPCAPKVRPSTRSNLI